MSKPRSRNSLLSSHNRSTFGTTTKDELLAQKFSMERPDAPLYPLNDVDGQAETYNDPSIKSNFQATFPDFKPWKDHTNLSNDKREQETSKLNNTSYLNKGYFEAPMVANEYYSARTLIQATVFTSTENCNEVLKELSQHLTNSFKARNEVINKIKYNSNKFKIPPRVTLTASKKEAWLRDLANPEIPFQKIGEKIPHGIRNKILVDAVCTKTVPINRALWFTKCVLYGELIALRRKHQARLSFAGTVSHTSEASSLEKFEDHWLQEWTQQVSDYVYRFSKEITNFSTPERKGNYMIRLRYLLTLVESLYIECLLDKNLFLSLIIKFLKEGLPLEPMHISELLSLSTNDGEDVAVESWMDEVDLNYGQRLVALTLIKVFWKDILKLDYLCKELSESLLLNYYFIDTIAGKQTTSTTTPRSILPSGLKQSIMTMIGDTVNYLFKFNTNMFIIPNYWILINGVLFKILLEGTQNSGEEEADVSKQLELVKFRNESLILSMKNVPSAPLSVPSHERRSSLLGPQTIVSPIPVAGILDEESVVINRNSDDVFQIINQLDLLKLNNNLANILKPISGSTVTKANNWKINLRVVVYWCITRFRSERESSEGILVICNFLKRKVFSGLNPKAKGNPKAEFENELLEIIYYIAENDMAKIDKYKLYVLINELCQLKVISIGSYLRKFIASGIFYLSPGADENIMADDYNPLVETHLSILQNLPIINNRQFDSILKKLSSSPSDLKEKFEKGKDILKYNILEKVASNDPSPDFTESLTYVTGLNVGIKFLLVNWITNELKTTILNSPKLVHITPLVIANLYDFYSNCDNLTVFFKIVVKFLLKNEGGVIILYLDSLYLISRLLIRHFKLLKFVAGNTHNTSDSTCYDLFKLVIQTYKDFQSREFDYFRFDQVWTFVDGVFDKTLQNEVGQNQMNKKKAFANIFEKDSIDSPMKINTHELGNGKGGSDKYTPGDFRSDLDSLLQNKFRPMDVTEVKELLGSLKLNVDITSPLSLKKAAFTLIENLWSSGKTGSEEVDVQSIKLLVNLRNSLGFEMFSSFNLELTSYIESLMLDDKEIPDICHFYKKLIIYEVIKVTDLMSILDNVKDKVPERVSRVVLDVLLHDSVESFSSNQTLLLKVIRLGYRDRSSASFHHYILRSLNRLEGPISENETFLELKTDILKYFNQVLVTSTRLILDEFISKLQFDDAIFILNSSLIRPSTDFVKCLKDFKNVSSEVDEFNMPIYQLLLRVICQQEISRVNKVEQKQSLSFIVESFVQNLNFTFSSYNSYIGECLNFMVWDDKVCILEILETMFLRGTKFLPSEDAISSNKAVDLSNILETVNLLPVFNDFFKKFSASSTSIVESSHDFFTDLSRFLVKLLELVNAEELFVFEEDISNTISVFLRMLIIHKITLTNAIIVYDGDQFTFIKNLIALLNSKFLSDVNEKLRILLYDLLLLMKLSITQEINSLGDNAVVEPTSPDFVGGGAQGSPPADDQTKISGDNSSAFNPSSISNISQVASLFNLPEPNANNPLESYIDEAKIESVLTLDEDELQCGGDIHSFNDRNLMLVSSRTESVSLSNAFGILGSTPTTVKSKRDFKLRSFEILEDSSSSLNDGCINLQLFDAYTTKENPA
ncbi:subunit of activation mediator subcomplex of RNA polymerase II holoenzyme [Scheffersomyces coipomensis]|uniref:subunit of activation mediator subcomplex of RNA polymerase II holoenzyme n=1 Tax=Scheffersomyces coipomensis TaxID=1788519 RepID=UPI00315CFD3D